MNTEIIDYTELTPTPTAWIGYDRTAFMRGELVIDVCAECTGTREAERMATRLRCRSFRTLCARHLAERTARRLGETL